MSSRHPTLTKELSDQRYLSKPELERELGKNNFFLMKPLIDNYRHNYQVDIKLPVGDGNNFKLTLTPTLLLKISKIECQFINNISVIINLNVKELALTWCEQLSAQIGVESIKSKLGKENPELDVYTAPIFAFYQAIIAEGKIEFDWIKKLFTQFDCSDEVFFRTNPSFIPEAKIADALQALIELVDNNLYSPLLTGLIIYTYFIYLSPFAHSNEYIAHVLLFHYLKSQYTYCIPIAPIIIYDDQVLNQIKSNCYHESDLTYLLYFFIDIIYNDVKGFKANFSFKEENKSKTLINPNDYSKDDFVRELLAFYPQLKEMHAQFIYQNYCSQHYYKIADFKKMFNVSYETARTAMELLVSIGYYKKEKYKNKFVYRT